MQINAKALNNAIRALAPLTKEASKSVWIVKDGPIVTIRAAGDTAMARFTLDVADLADHPSAAAAVAATDLARAVRGVKGDVDVTIQTDAVRVTGNGSTVNLTNRSGRYAPPAPPGSSKPGHTFTRAMLTAIDKTVRPAAANDATRPMLCGVRFDGEGSVIATDGHRMHVAKFPYEMDPVTIPNATWDVIVAFAAARGDEYVTVDVDGSTVHASGHNWAIHDTACGGTYPAWRQVMPVNVDNEAGIDAGELSAACKPHVTARKMARKLEATRVTVNGSVRLVTVAGDANAETSVPCLHIGEERRTAVDVNYLADAAAALAGVTKIALPADPFSPIMVSDANTRCVIMPMRV